MAGLRFQEDYIKEQADDIKNKCEALEKGIDEYRNILTTVTETAIKDGVTHKALNEFNALVSELEGKLKWQL